MQADQAGCAVGGLPAQPGLGLGHDHAGALDRDRQLVKRAAHPPAHPAAERLRDGPAPAVRLSRAGDAFVMNNHHDEFGD